MKHSNIVGGSSAKRVMECPGSVALVARMPEQPSSSYADEGTLLHDVIADALNGMDSPLGRTHGSAALTQELIDEKITPALAALDEIDAHNQMEYAVESNVSFGKYLPDVFGSADYLGRMGDRALVLDWKFGSGVIVTAEENAQLMFYAAAAMRTQATAWVFDGATEVELVIVQPPEVRRWVTSVDRIKQFERDLKAAVTLSAQPDAPLKAGAHCKWCRAKPVCPVMTGAVDRVAKAKLDALPVDQIAHYLDQIPVVEAFLKDLQQLAHTMIEGGKTVPGWKLVNKRATRRWLDPEAAADYLLFNGFDAFEERLITPAAAEKQLKKVKQELPADLVVAVSSGSTLAPETDPRQSVLQIGQVLISALSKIQ
jgi:hypothetical protein